MPYITYSRLYRPVAGGHEFANIDADLRKIYPNAEIQTYCSDVANQVLAFVDTHEASGSDPDLYKFPAYSPVALTPEVAVMEANRLDPPRTVTEIGGVSTTYSPWREEGGRLTRDVISI